MASESTHGHQQLIIHINGWPGSGKKTVGRIVAARLAGRIVDNQTINGPAAAVADFGSPMFKRMVGNVRDLVYAHITQSPENEVYVLTTVLVDVEEDIAIFETVKDLAKTRRSAFLPVTLDCNVEENVGRLDGSGRAERYSLTDPEVLRSLREKYDLLRPDVDVLLELDTTSTSPETNAMKIAEAAQKLVWNNPG